MAEQRLPSSDAVHVAMFTTTATDATDTAVPLPPCRHINVHIPAELLEMILLAAGEDWHFVFSMVCRRWWAVLESWRNRGKGAAAMMCGSKPMMRTPWFVGQHTVQLAAWAHTNGLPLTRARLPALLRELAIDVLDSGPKTFDGNSVLECLTSALECNRCDDDDILPYCIGLCSSRPTCLRCRRNLSSVHFYCTTAEDEGDFELCDGGFWVLMTNAARDALDAHERIEWREHLAETFPFATDDEVNDAERTRGDMNAEAIEFRAQHARFATDDEMYDECYLCHGVMPPL